MSVQQVILNENMSVSWNTRVYLSKCGQSFNIQYVDIHTISTNDMTFIKITHDDKIYSNVSLDLTKYTQFISLLNSDIYYRQGLERNQPVEKCFHVDVENIKINDNCLVFHFYDHDMERKSTFNFQN